MLKLLTCWALFVAGVLTALLFLASSRATAGSTIYSWQTEDGVYAFTDDAKSVPTRYRAQVQTRSSAALDGYERFTPQVPSASDRYAEQLAARLEHLRAVNAGPAAEKPAQSERREASRTVSLRIGGEDSPSIDITSGDDEKPIVMEEVFTKPFGKVKTRQSVVVRQGDKTLAIVKPRLRETDVARDILSEEELER
jgi:hypothetical protein